MAALISGLTAGLVMCSREKSGTGVAGGPAGTKGGATGGTRVWSCGPTGGAAGAAGGATGANSSAGGTSLRHDWRHPGLNSDGDKEFNVVGWWNEPGFCCVHCVNGLEVHTKAALIEGI